MHSTVTRRSAMLIKAKESFCNQIKDVLYYILKILFVFPINNKRIIFYSFGGRQYSCNPMYISKYMLKKYPNQFQLIWAIDDTANPLLKDTNVKVVKYNSLAFIYYRITSKVIITNDLLPSYIPSRKKQIHINTWHGGGCYKKTKDPNKAEPSRLEKLNITHFVSTCKLFTEMEVKKDFHFEGEILSVGSPRNDIIFNNNNEYHTESIGQKVRNYYHIIDGVPIILYAPTWRADSTETFFLPDFDFLSKKYEAEFGVKPVIVIRAHHGITSKIESQCCIDATDYADVQELLVASDILITDYSSIAWDFSFSSKPCFLFTPDLDEYRKVQGFHIDPEDWGFPVCRDTEALTESIIYFDHNDYIKKMQRHHEMFGSYEHGNACEKVADFIIKEINNSSQ